MVLTKQNLCLEAHPIKSLGPYIAPLADSAQKIASKRSFLMFPCDYGNTGAERLHNRSAGRLRTVGSQELKAICGRKRAHAHGCSQLVTLEQKSSSSVPYHTGAFSRDDLLAGFVENENYYL